MLFWSFTDHLTVSNTQKKKAVHDLNKNRLLFNIVLYKYISFHFILSNLSQHSIFLCSFLVSIYYKQEAESSRIAAEFVTSVVVLVMLSRGNKNYEIYYENLFHFRSFYIVYILFHYQYNNMTLFLVWIRKVFLVLVYFLYWKSIAL